MIRTKNYGNIYITTTRFNSDTYKENRRWRKKHNIEGCIYGTPIKMSPLIPLHANTFIIEMNNYNNKINGIGFLLNRPYLKEQIKIYKDNNYNRYIYRGMFRISRHYLKKNYNNELNSLEKLVFQGATHCKRGHGISLIPNKNRNKIEQLESFFINLFL